MLKDFTPSAFTMGLLAAFVGTASSFAIVLQGLRAMGASEAEAASGERQRSRDSIRLGLEKLKSSFNKLYQRELRNDPFLAGRVELEFVVESSGEVSYCRVASSGLNNSALESKLCNRLKLADFGAESVARATELQSFNFEPN